MLRYGQNGYGYSPSGYLKYKVSRADTTSFSYDAFGNLVSVRLADGTWVQYLIDAANRRVGNKVNGVTTQRLLYSGNLKPVAALDSTGSVVTRYVFATHENVPEYMVRGGVVYRFVLDHLGSVRLVVNSQTGEIAQRLDYDEFGNVLFDSNPEFQAFGYAGGLYDQETNLVRFGARDYDAQMGRWTAKDPIGFEGNDNNLYAYCSFNPTSFNDSDGKFAGFSNSLSNSQANQQSQRDAQVGTSRMQCVGEYLGKLSPLKRYPNKMSKGGKLQPYNPKNGQYLGWEFLPTISPEVDYSLGLA